jgi:hypothetical protein
MAVGAVKVAEKATENGATNESEPIYRRTIQKTTWHNT